MQPNPGQSSLPSEDQSRSRTARRLIIAVALIGLAVAGLAAVDRLRERSAPPAPPHEPAQALIATPAPIPAESAPQPVAPPPPQVVNDHARAPAPPPAFRERPARKTPSQGAFIVQAGTFKSTANARALQKQLQHAGLPAHLETRVQLGPFKTRSDADKALARAKKLGIAAVLIGPY